MDSGSKKQPLLGNYFQKGPNEDARRETPIKSELNAKVDLHPAVKKTRQLPTSITNSSSLVNPSSISYNSTSKFVRTSSAARKDINRYADDPEYVAPTAKKSSKFDEDDDYNEPTIEDVTYNLSVSQKRALDAIMQRKSVFFTGAAGTGKSYVIQILRKVLESLNLENKIVFTAPTGVAACNIQGLTIHSWSGVGKASEPLEQLVGMVTRSSHATKRWRDTDILVIDEVSMLPAELFDKLDIIGRRVRNNTNPFGGLQLILCGDFYQLPPVGLGRGVSFCFESRAWKEIFGKRPDCMIVLEKVFRQKDDTTFLNLLHELRVGHISQHTFNILTRKVQEATQLEVQSGGIRQKDKIEPTKLFSTNNDVDAYNSRELQFLLLQAEEGTGASSAEDNESYTYTAVDEGRDPYLTQLRNGTKAPVQLTLRRGAQVMLLKNLDTESGLVNGARGIVTGFERAGNKSNFHRFLPIVTFYVALGGQARREETITLVPETWDVKVGSNVEATRLQIPLILAWAISIHKSQGMTIPLLEVSFNRMFEYGQAYVALSRATSLEGLTLRSFQANCVKAHPTVKAFYEHMIELKQRYETSMSTSSTSSLDDVVCSVELKAFVSAFNREFDGKKVNNDEWVDAKPIIKSAQSSLLYDPVTGKRKQLDLEDEFKLAPPSRDVKFEQTMAMQPKSSSSGGANKPNFQQYQMQTAQQIMQSQQAVKKLKVSPPGPPELIDLLDSSDDNEDQQTQHQQAQQQEQSASASSGTFQSPYGNTAHINTNTATAVSNQWPEDIKARIEANRLQAIQKLKLFREQQNN